MILIVLGPQKIKKIYSPRALMIKLLKFGVYNHDLFYLIYMYKVKIIINIK